MAKPNFEIKKPKLDISMDNSSRKGAKIAAAVAAIGNVNTKPCTGTGCENLLKRHGKEKFQITL